MTDGFKKSFNRKPRPPREGRAPARPSFGDRPPRKRDGEWSDRPPREGRAPARPSFGDRPPRKRDGEWSDRPPREGRAPARPSFGDRPPRKRDGEWSDRPPRREWSDRPPREGRAPARPSFGDRPPRKRDGERFDRPPQEGRAPARPSFGDRPPRKRDDDFGDRPPREGRAPARPSFGDRPPRKRDGEWSDRPPREGRAPARPSFGDRPPRKRDGEWSDRPPRKRDGADFGSDRPRSGFGSRPSKHEMEEVNPNEGLPVRRQRLVVFGGSFDPVHRAHIELARRILDQDYGDEVMFMPAKQSPLKEMGQSATAQMRLEMLNLAIADALAEKPKFTLVKKPPRWAPEGTPDEVTEHDYVFSVSDLELQRPGERSYTYDTLCTLKRAFPEKRIIFLMGTDKLEEIPRWYRYGELVQQFDFMIYPRPGSPASSYLQMAKYMGDAIAAKIHNSLLPDNPEKFPQMDLSSTEVRIAIASGEDLSQKLSPSVLQYIQEHGLYQLEQEAPKE